MTEIKKPILLNETGQEGNQILRELVTVQKANVLSGGNPAAVDLLYKGLVNAARSMAEVNTLFIEWWKACWVEGTTTRNALCERWFGRVLDDERIHGVKFPLFSTSASAIGELTDDSVGLICKPSTSITEAQDDFCYLPQFWTLEVSMERNADGTHTIYAVEHIDPISEVRSGVHLCEVLQKNTYLREWREDGYHCMRMRCHPAPGYFSWPQGEGKNGRRYSYMASPKYYAGMDATGTITCGTNLPPVNWTSHTSGVALWRKRGTHYSGAAGNLLKFQLAMMWLKYARKGNSGTIEGCSSYNYQYLAAASETGVERVIITTAQAANLFVGSAVQIGIQSGTDRNTASNYSVGRNLKITAIEEVTISGTAYAAVYVDNKGVKFDTTADATYMSTDPYWSGWNDDVLGVDGSRYSPTSGKEPGLIQKTEFMNGSYLIISDELWQWSKDDAGNFCFDCYTCHDQSKVSGSTITSDYTKQTDLTLRFPESVGAWWYVEDIAIANDKGVLWPASVSARAGSGTGAKAGFYVGTAESGVRAGWACGNLNNNGNAGLPARNSNNSTSNANWNGSVGCPSGCHHVCIIKSVHRIFPVYSENCLKPASLGTALHLAEDTQWRRMKESAGG